MIPWALIGGGAGSFFGPVHRMAAALDGRFKLVAGAFSRSPENNRQTAEGLGCRAYEDFAELARSEAARPDGARLVTVATPNHLHFPVAKACLESGLDVLCEKPMTLTLDQAETLAALVAKSGRTFVLAHTYTGYAMVREARRLVAEGALGRIRVVQVEYAQDWLASAVDSRQAEWRLDPARSGAGGSLGDIGTHAFQLAQFVTGLKVQALAADLDHFGAGRSLDDNAHVLLRFEGGAKGMLWCSQIAIGRKNGLQLRVYGEKGALEWAQEQPELLHFAKLGEPASTLVRTQGRVPAGHPEGFIEALAELYRDTADTLAGKGSGLLPSARDGVEGLRFVTAAVASSGAWVPL